MAAEGAAIVIGDLLEPEGREGVTLNMPQGRQGGPTNYAKGLMDPEWAVFIPQQHRHVPGEKSELALTGYRPYLLEYRDYLGFNLSNVDRSIEAGIGSL